jgi:type IV secretion system protein VirB1
MDMIHAIQQCALNIEPAAIIAVMKQESNLRPYRININRSQVKLKIQPKSYQEAVTWSKYLIKQGYNIDMGLMQINSANLKRLHLTVETAFNPCTNLRAGAQILFENYQRASSRYGHGKVAFYSALSAYNTGSFAKGFKNGYVGKVIKNLKHTLQPLQKIEKEKKLFAMNQVTAPDNKIALSKTKIALNKSIADLAVEEKLRSTYSYASKPIN